MGLFLMHMPFRNLFNAVVTALFPWLLFSNPVFAIKCAPKELDLLIASPDFAEKDQVKNYLNANMQFPQMNSGIYLTAMSNFIARNGSGKLSHRKFSDEQVAHVSDAMDKAHAAFGITVNFASPSSKTERVRGLADAFSMLTERIYKVAKLLKGEPEQSLTVEQKADWINEFQVKDAETWQKLRRVCARAVLFMRSKRMLTVGNEYRTLLTTGYRENNKRAAPVAELIKKQEEVTDALKSEFKDALNEEFPAEQYPNLSEEARTSIMTLFVLAHG